jgi:hypothetical protein
MKLWKSIDDFVVHQQMMNGNYDESVKPNEILVLIDWIIFEIVQGHLKMNLYLNEVVQSAVD